MVKYKSTTMNNRLIEIIFIERLKNNILESATI